MPTPTEPTRRGPTAGQISMFEEPKKKDAPKEDWRTKVPSVSQLTRRIRGHIENSFFDVWVKGEISNFRKPASGHAYFVLKDANAQLRSVSFRGQLSRLKFKPEDGMEVLAHGKVSVYEARGEYQIIIDHMEPVGVGALQLAFEQLKAKLQKEGLFEKTHKKPLPPLPAHIGVVTSPTGAAVRDILKVLHRRYPDRQISVLPAAVQGEKAAPEIVTSIKTAEAWNKAHTDNPIEVLIVGRGGGSLEDMWCFNEEIVARAIYECSIPIISSVGHEIDFTIADFVADVRAPTPSAAAEIVVPLKSELVYRVQQGQGQLQRTMHKRLEQMRLHLDHLTQRLIDPRERIAKMRADFANLCQRLNMAITNQLQRARQSLESSAQLLNTLSPLQVVGRGYSITEDTKGQVIRSIKSLKKDNKIRTRLEDGFVHSIVTQTENLEAP